MFRRPSYLLGRFATVRDAYSLLHRLKDSLAGAAPLRIADLYHAADATIDVAASGHVLSTKTAAQQVEEMRKQSYSLGPHLDKIALAELQRCARTLPLHFNEADVGTYEALSQSPERRGDLALATIRNSARLPLIRALAGDKTLYEAASLFLGYRPTEVSCWFFWSLANHLSDDERRAASQTIDYHYDVNGFNFLYINFYLLDTDEMNGAHALIAGSSRRKRLRHLLGSARLSDNEVRETYGPEAERVIEGPAGSGFLEDTSCYHKALAPISADRLMLQLRYQ
ncbi:MAG: hypothetical protein PSV46_08695 [Reyranella sp.]|nr:hypothetical protein [Reyranella sp.]